MLIHNHFPANASISDKKNLLLHLTRYLHAQHRDVFQLVPQTYELNDLNHPVLATLQLGQADRQHWIIKPGENSNRGRGITIAHSSAEAAEELRRRLGEEAE